MVIAVLNSKGGVGKTTAALHLAAALAGPDRRLLLVDLDGQASASLWCGVQRGRLRPSAASVLLHDFPIEQAIRNTAIRHLDLITGASDLANADLVLAEIRGRELTLKNALQRVRSRYELIILDCPPSMSLLSVNALVAADALIVPVAPQPLAVEALGNLLASLEKVPRRLGSRARLLGVLINMSDGAASEVCERLRAQFPDRLFHTEIPASRALADAAGAGETVFTFAPRSRAADAFQRLAGEVLERLRR